MELDIILEKQEEGGYTVYVPSLPGCVSQGETKEECLKNIEILCIKIFQIFQ